MLVAQTDGRPPPGTSARALEIELELAHRLRAHVPGAMAWASFVTRHSPDDVQARLGMGDAIRRRFASAAQLTAEIRSSGAGRWIVKSTRGVAYNAEIYGKEPGAGDCDCPDFLNGSLGVCKHIAHLLSRGARGFAKPPLLTWNPIRPWSGADAQHARLELRQPPPLGCERFWRRLHDDVFRIADRLGAGPDVRLVRHLAALADALGRRATPAARAVVRQLAREVEEWHVLAANERKCRGLMLRSKRRLFPFQREGVARLLSRGRLLLGDDMGLGKTTQAIVAAAALLKSGAVRKALFIVPAPLRTQWAREWESVTDYPIVIAEGRPEERRGVFERAKKGAFLVSYEAVVRDAESLRAWAPDLVVLDEAQRIKNWATRTSGIMKSFTPRYRWALTGTPFENRLDELASLLEWLGDDAMEPKWRLDCFHAERADGATTVVGARNLSTLRARIAPRILRRSKSEVLSQLPERTDVPRALPLTDWQRSDHDAMNRDIAMLVSIRQRRPLSAKEFLQLMKLLNRQRMISNAAILPEDAQMWNELKAARPEAVLASIGSPKLEELRELVREVVVTGGQKAAIFTQWRRMAKWAHWAVRDLLDARGLRAGFFTGAEPESRRRENVIRFHDDPSFRLLFLTDAGGVGLNLQRAASVLINLEYPWNPAVLEQRVGRIYRIGQKDPVQVYLLSSSEGIESRIGALVSDKKALFRGVFDGEDDLVTFERSGSFLARLERVLPRASGLAATTEDADEPATTDTAAPEDDALSPATSGETNIPGRSEDAAILSAAQPAAAAASAELRAVARSALAAVRMERLADGSLRLEAPPESAAVLASLFRTMADLFMPAAMT